jgi:predicted HicB family RNase H-like nuclease
MNTLSYKDYKAAIAFDEDDGIFVGRIVGINDVVGFHADSVAGLKAAFEAAMEDYLTACKKIGKEPDKAYSGNLMLRVDPLVHSKAVLAAELAGMSLNQWGAKALEKAADEFVSDGDNNYAETRLAS